MSKLSEVVNACMEVETNVAIIVRTATTANLFLQKTTQLIYTS